MAASLVAAGNILSRLLGFVREPVIAALFGATGTADAFEVATRIPNMIFDVIVGGGIAAVLVPMFSGLTDSRGAEFGTFLQPAPGGWLNHRRDRGRSRDFRGSVSSHSRSRLLG